MEFIRQSVDDRDGAGLSQRGQIALFECADHDTIHHARENPGGIRDGFPAAQLDVGRGEEKRGAAQLRNPYFKGDVYKRQAEG